MKLFTWIEGRQKSAYDKMLLATARWPIPFDCYILRFPEGSYINPHVDPVQEGKHYRLNIVIKKSNSGGEFLCDNSIINLSRIKLFRPDLYTHSVTKVEGGSRYVLSIGWIRK